MESTTFQIVQRKSGRTHHVIVDLEDYDRVAGMGRWTHHPQGYAFYQPNRETPRVYLHRFVLGLHRGDPLVDHRNGNGLDNRKSNLRLADKSTNAGNQAVVNNYGTSKHRGVFWDASRQLWRAEQIIQGKVHRLGRFSTEEAALDALTKLREQHDLLGF